MKKTKKTTQEPIQRAETSPGVNVLFRQKSNQVLDLPARFLLVKNDACGIVTAMDENGLQVPWKWRKRKASERLLILP